MAAAEGDGAARAKRLERLAVALSFWIGGAGLAAMKGLAYMATGSVLVRAAMFESLGDVVSSAIMVVTQWKVGDMRDRHLYPVGKGRLVPLGVLFFCAFMCSAMSSMALDALQNCVVSGGDDDGTGEGAEALRRLFSDRPNLRSALGSDDVDTVVAAYGASSSDGPSIDHTSVWLIVACVATKFFLYVFCRAVVSLRNSEIVSALAKDHGNDTISNSIVIAVMVLLARGGDAPWLSKVDPGSSLFLSLWILYGWVCTALEQIQTLSDRRIEDADASAIVAAVQGVLKAKGAPMELCDLDVHHAGEGSRVRLAFRPVAGSAGRASRELAETFEALEAAVKGASEVDVYEVDTQLRIAPPRRQPGDASWVAEYAAVVGP